MLWGIPGGAAISIRPASDADTLITLEKTTVTASRQHISGTGSLQQTVKPAATGMHYFQGLDAVIAAHTGIYVKSYGPGLLATTSLRGGAAGHTALLWNGFQIQSPMNGQADLSLIPSFFADEITIQYGGGSALWGSGSMGGSIHLNSGRTISRGTNLSAGLGFSNTGEAARFVRIEGARNMVSSRLRILHSDADNRYKYRNPRDRQGDVRVQEHAAARQWGLMHETFLNVSERHRGDIRWWWQGAARDIPPPLMQSNFGATQEDEAFRLSGQWQMLTGNTIVTTRGALFNESLLYFDSLNGESLSRSRQLTHESEAAMMVHPSLMANTGIHTQWTKARADDYRDATQQRHQLAAFGSLRWEALPGKVYLQVSGRQEAVDGETVPFAPAFALSWQMRPGVTFKANMGRNYRIPTLNDKYWSPGGNPDLEPEKARSYDATIEFNKPDPGRGAAGTGTRQQPGISIQGASLTGYLRNTTNWIVWMPGSGSMYWTPQNVRQVQSYGFESRVRANAGIGRVLLVLDAYWDHAVAENRTKVAPGDASYGKQLIYVPRNTMGSDLRLTIGRATLSYAHHYTGRRYTSSDNKHRIPHYHTGDVTLQYTFRANRYNVNAYASAGNIWNTSYEMMQGRPMPLRHFRAGILLEINNVWHNHLSKTGNP